MLVSAEIVAPANYNCPGQLVISGSIKGIEIACEQLKAAGAKRALVLPVGGAFHSPFMLPAKAELAAAINEAIFKENFRDNDFKNLNIYSSHGSVDQVIPVDWARKTKPFLLNK